MSDWLPDASNPYFSKAKMIREPEMFFGRADLLRQVYETVAHRQCVSIVGPRGIGKSSFLWYASLPAVQAQFPFELGQHIFIFLDLREYLRKTCEDFFHKVSKEIIAEGKKWGLTLYSDEDNGEDEFSSVLDQLKEHGLFPVLLLDAFDKITLNEHFDLEFFEFLRAQASMDLVAYITASIAPLYDVCHRGVAGSPFFNIFYRYQMGALLPEEAQALITSPLQRVGISLSNTEIASVLKWAGHHPFFIQHVCYLLYEEKQNCVNGEINERRLQSRAFKELIPHFQDTWEQLSYEHQLLIQDEVQQKEKQFRELPELSGSSLFRQFVRNINQIGLFHMNVDELEAALENIDDRAELGETNLRFMKKVALRLKIQHTSPTPIEKGIAIRAVLNEALQNLSGSGPQSDIAPDWECYNILNYRYFKHHLNNEVIAGRLGMSVRKYYRERKKAIESLLNVLVQMEKSADGLDMDE